MGAVLELLLSNRAPPHPPPQHTHTLEGWLPELARACLVQERSSLGSDPWTLFSYMSSAGWMDLSEPPGLC